MPALSLAEEIQQEEEESEEERWTISKSSSSSSIAKICARHVPRLDERHAAGGTVKVLPVYRAGCEGGGEGDKEEKTGEEYR